MLEKLLSEIYAGGTFETGALAAKLGTTPQMMLAMLDHLQRAGFIQSYQTCGDGCAGCILLHKNEGPGIDHLQEKVPGAG